MGRSNPTERQPITDINWKFDFGKKWRGVPIWEVIASDEQYVHWCIENVPGFDVGDQVFAYVRDRYREGLNLLYKEKQ